MKTTKQYNIYLFISTFTRNIIDIYSIIYLYQKGITIKNIIYIYILIYSLGIIFSYLSLTIGNKIGYKYILILSTIFTTISVYILRKINNIYLIAIFLSLSIYTYHPIKHYYGLTILKNKKEVGYALIYTLISTTVSSYLAMKKINIIYSLIISIISIIPAIFIKKNSPVKISYSKKISKNKYLYFIFDQFKIIFILLEPLYLYTISNKLSYVGIFNIILTLSSIISIYFVSNKLNINKYYKYLNIIFSIILLMKININNKSILLIIAILEGICTKINELISTLNLYHSSNNHIGYLILSETIFSIIRIIILSTAYLLNISLKPLLHILIIGIIILGFTYKEKDTI